MMRLRLLTVILAASGCINADLSNEQAVSDVNAQVSKVLAQGTPCDDIDWCDTVCVALEAKSASPSSLGQRILVIDLGMVLPAYTRYKSRVLEHFVLDERGFYRSSKQEIRIPRTIFAVLSEILDDQNPATTAHQLNPVSSLFDKHNKVNNSLVQHGDEIFATLADLNPEAEFVIANLGSTPKEDFCSANEDHAAFERYGTFIRNSAVSLQSIIEKHGINFVNMSFGYSEETFMRIWRDSCSGKSQPERAFFLNIHEMYFRNFYEPLFSLDNVVFVQAAPYSYYDLEESSSEFYSDCQSVPNRIRVAGFSAKEPHLPILGADDEHLLSSSVKGALGCTDIAINFGISAKRPYEDGPFPVMTTINGFGASSLGTRPSSSSAAPIALSYMIYLKKSGDVQGEGTFFVDNFKKYHQGKLVEPARYRQFEINRLGRL